METQDTTENLTLSTMETSGGEDPSKHLLFLSF